MSYVSNDCMDIMGCSHDENGQQCMTYLSMNDVMMNLLCENNETRLIKLYSSSPCGIDYTSRNMNRMKIVIGWPRSCDLANSFYFRFQTYKISYHDEHDQSTYQLLSVFELDKLQILLKQNLSNFILRKFEKLILTA